MTEIQKTVYLVRHGQSIDNARPVFQSVDTPLSEKGLRQAEIVADRIANLDFEALVASPVLRARQTAETIAAKTGKDIILSDLFVERIKPVEIDGRSWEDPEALAIYKQWDDSLYGVHSKVLSGEDYTGITSRADKALAFLLSMPEQHIVAVTHGHFLRTIVARVLLGEDLTGQSLRRIQQVMSMENTAISVLRYAAAYDEEPRWRLWTHNDHAHFAESNIA